MASNGRLRATAGGSLDIGAKRWRWPAVPEPERRSQQLRRYARAVDMTNRAAGAAAEAGYIFGEFNFSAGGDVSRVQLERIK